MKIPGQPDGAASRGIFNFPRDSKIDVGKLYTPAKSRWTKMYKLLKRKALPSLGTDYAYVSCKINFITFVKFRTFRATHMNVNPKHNIGTHGALALKSIAMLAMCAATNLGLSSAVAAPILGSDLASFAVLGATGVTNVPTSTIGGNLGSAPNGSIGGGYVFTSGSLQSNTSAAQQAQLDLDAAFLALGAFGVGTTIGAGNLDVYQAAHGGVIAPGTYTLSAAPTNLTGDLYLDGGGNSNAVWVFQLDSTLITSSTSNVFVQNVGSGANVGVYWNVGSAATINGDTFAGNILARELISSDGNLTIDCGRLLSANNQVTLIKDKVSITNCAGASGGYDQGAAIGSGGTGGSNGEVVTFVPEPASLGLLGLGLLGLTASRRKSVAARQR